MVQVKMFQKWKTLFHIQEKEDNIVKMSVLPHVIYRFNATPIKILQVIFTDIYKLILKYIWSRKRPRIANTILKEKNKVEERTLPDFKISYKAAVVKTMLFW